jgi:hypothetical protein
MPEKTSVYIHRHPVQYSILWGVLSCIYPSTIRFLICGKNTGHVYRFRYAYSIGILSTITKRRTRPVSGAESQKRGDTMLHYIHTSIDSTRGCVGAAMSARAVILSGMIGQLCALCVPSAAVLMICQHSTFGGLLRRACRVQAVPVRSPCALSKISHFRAILHFWYPKTVSEGWRGRNAAEGVKFPVKPHELPSGLSRSPAREPCELPCR